MMMMNMNDVLSPFDTVQECETERERERDRQTDERTDGRTELALHSFSQRSVRNPRRQFDLYDGKDLRNKAV